jgi:hypothetical protein
MEDYQQWLGQEQGRENDLARLIDNITKEREDREREATEKA